MRRKSYTWLDPIKHDVERTTSWRSFVGTNNWDKKQRLNDITILMCPKAFALKTQDMLRISAQ